MTTKTILLGMAAAIAVAGAAQAQTTPEKVTGWGDFKLYIDPGHEGTSNMGIWSYSEAEKVLAVGLNIKDMLENLTDMPAENLQLCRYTIDDRIGLEERSDAANAWGADFYYSIHSDAGNVPNQIVLLFGGWKKDGQLVEKTPNGGKRFGEFLEPNLSGVMRIGSRGNRYDRDFYMSGEYTHEYQYPYLSVNRRSNMPSLLSEGGYHTQALQQRRNINAEYKRLEALAAFQSILQYRGMELPKQTFLHGMVYNSENEQPINGAKVTVDGKTYTTDTYESVFHKYTKNPNLIYNGLYTFENLEAGKTYEITFEAEGFETVKKEVTIKGGGTTTPDFVTFLDVALTNTAPAKVDAISLESLVDVSPLYPLVITFSRNMDRASVENAFTISKDGVGLDWLNDYTLSVDLSALEPMWDYTITIDGSIAKNSQTGMLFDGDGDGQPGGDYVLTFVMAEPDVEAPKIVSTYPAEDSEVMYTHRPPVRVEFDEMINWNDDKDADAITVKDKDGNVVEGTVKHDIVRGRSVIHFIAKADYPADRTFLVTVKEGLADMSGNLTKAEHFRFMTEYRPVISTQTVVGCTGLDNFWNPGGSGSTSGIDKDNSTTSVMYSSPNYLSSTSTCMNYIFDPSETSETWFIRLHNPEVTKKQVNDFGGMFTVWVYGDGSNNAMDMMVRIPNSGGGLKYKSEPLVLDFIGWNLFTWSLLDDEYNHFTGDQVMGATGGWRFDSFTLKHEDTDPDDEDIPYQEWEGSVGFNSLEYTKWDNENAERTAKIDDIALPTEGVNNISADNNDAKAEYFNLQGVRIDAPAAGNLVIERRGNVVTKKIVK